MPFVVDASIALAWTFEDERPEYALQILASMESDQAIVPPHWPTEVANGLLVGERRGRLQMETVTRALRDIAILPISVREAAMDASLSRILNLARAQQLTVYDAAYLDLAMREGLPLATLDEDLTAAAQRTGVALVP